MLKRIMFALLSASLIMALMPGLASAYTYAGVEGPNQGAEKYVKLVEPLRCEPTNGVECPSPLPWWCEDCKDGVAYMAKQEGDFGRVEHIWTHFPIKAVTVKSGKKGEVVWSDKLGKGTFFNVPFKGGYLTQIVYTQDISNYVVWFCKKPPCEPPCGDS